jgi:phospholipid/cholesterol/gamma-HCH transport system substrate-binding protein
MNPRNLIRPLAYLTALVMIVAAVAIFWPEDEKDDKYQVTAYFEKAIGLFENSDVNVLGVPVGKVLEVDPSGHRVKVTMELQKKYKVPADATAQIVPISVISDRFVEFAPAYTGGPVMPDGAVLDVDKTVIPAELDDVFKQLKKLLDAIQPGGPGEPGALGELIVELDQAFSGREDDLQGALTEGARLTDTLASTKEDLQGLLGNLDTLFSKLATRSSEFGTLNENLIIVLTAINESRDDLEGTLENLADLTEEVTDLVRDDGKILEDDLRRAVVVLKTVLKNEQSVRKSLDWLPIVGFGLRNAYDPSEVDAVNVRDNLTGKIKCSILDDLPDLLDPIKEILEEICKEETGEPQSSGPSDPVTATTPQVPIEVSELSCDKGVKRVKKQLKRIDRLGLPDDVKRELLEPLGKRLKKLAKKCDELVDKVEDPDEFLDDLLDDLGNLPDVGDLPNVQDTLDDTLTGNAAADQFVPTEDAEEEDDRSWVDGVLGFLGL